MRGHMIKMRFLSATKTLAGVLIGAGVAATAVPALAQESWSLPPGADSAQAQRPAGPVDSQNPVVARPGNAPEAVPSPQVTLPAAPPPTVRAPTIKAPEKAPPVTATATAARPTAAPSTAPSAAPSTAPSAVASPIEPAAPSPFVPPVEQPGAATSTPAQPAAAAPASHWPEWWLAIPVALVLAGLGVFALLRRRAAPATAWEEAGLEPEAEDDETPEAREAPSAQQRVPQPRPASPVAAAASARPASAVAPKPLASPIVSPRRAPIAGERAQIAFEPVLMRQSLVYATLVYRMRLTAPAEGLPEGAVIAADMIAAHASLSQAEQLAPDPTSVPPRHRFEPLAPGETREVKGEIQLPLNAIRPVRQGNAMLFVPLLRLFLALPDGSIERRVFSLGLPGEGNGGGLAPVRVDTGPRDHAPIQAREIDGARSYSGPHVPQAAE